MSTSRPAPAPKQHRLPAAYYRGGTSRAIIFKAQDLPPDKARWPAIFRGVLGSPDPAHGRQLDGLGGGLSSLSKVCVVGAPSRVATADVDYTFAAVGVRDDDVDFSSNCGNMSAAVGPFAVDSGLVRVSEKNLRQDGTCVINIHNTNTGKIIRATFPLAEGGDEAAAGGSFAMDGVAGTGGPIRLDFLHPGGSRTGKLLPTGQRAERIGIPHVLPQEGGGGESESVVHQAEVTCIDVGNPCVFVRAQDLLRRHEGDSWQSTTSSITTPQALEEDKQLMREVDHLRRQAGVRMGLAPDGDPARVPASVPKIALIWTPPPPQDDDERTGTSHLCVRAFSVAQPHQALPVTVALALAAAAQLPGTVVHACARRPSSSQEGGEGGGALVMRHPTGSMSVDAVYDDAGNLESAAVYRTARRLMEGTVFWK